MHPEAMEIIGSGGGGTLVGGMIAYLWMKVNSRRNGDGSRDGSSSRDRRLMEMDNDIQDIKINTRRHTEILNKIADIESENCKTITKLTTIQEMMMQKIIMQPQSKAE